MSGPSGSSTLPAWKQALLDRKRRPGDLEGAPTGVESTGGSSWKQTSLGKKLLKYTDQGKGITGRPSESEGYIPAAAGEAPEIRVVELTGSGSGDDLLAAEERLLPIKQNPILLSDRQRRPRVKPILPKTPTLSPKITDSETHGATSPSANHTASPSYTQQHPGGGDDSGDEVFGEEVAYGKGFVHKLMQKFINLSGKDEPAPATVGTSKSQSRARSSGENHGDNARSSGSYYSNCNGEETNASKSPIRVAAESSVQHSQTAGMSFGKALVEPGSKVDQEPSANKSPIIDTEDLPQNIVSTTRDIFEHSGPTNRNKPVAVEKSNSERVTLVKRTAPEAPSTDPVLLCENGDAKKVTGNLNQAATTIFSMEKPSSVAAAAKLEPEIKSHQVLPMNRVLYSASGTKKTSGQETPLQRSQITTNRSVVTERTDSSREHSVAPSGHTQRKDNFSSYSVNSVKPNDGSDIKVEVGKVSSMVGSWGLKSTTADDCDDRVGSQDRLNEPISAKIKQKQELQTGDALFNEHPKPSPQSDLGDGSSVKQSNEHRDTPRSFGGLSGGTKIKIESLSDGIEPDRMGGQTRAQQYPIRSADNKSPVDILKDNFQSISDAQKEIERNAEVDRMTTRIRVGGYADHPQSQISSPTRSVPTTSSIQTENQVTVVRVGGGLPPTMFQDNKAENEHGHLSVPQQVEGLGVKTSAFENARNSIITEGKSTKITVGYDRDKSDSVYAKNSANDINVLQNNAKNAVSNKVNISDDTTREDPFMRSSTRSYDVSQRLDSKSPGVSRPGKLLIRPASNHPASKTKTEFLTMTKFNDIKTGEFAPAKRTPVKKDELMNGDSVDRGRSPIDDLEQFVIIGGGVSVGKSLLTKTKRREKVRFFLQNLQSHFSFKFHCCLQF